MRSIGIDIGTFSAKVCVVNSTKKGLFIERFSERILVASDPFDRDIEVIEFLRAELGNEDQMQTKFVGSIPEDQVSLHTKIFPFKDRIKIFRSLPFELEEDTPFNPDETIFDGRIVRYEASQSEVLACACPKETIKKSLQILSDSGISVQLLTPEGMAYSNHFERWFDPIPVVPFIVDASLPSELPQPPRECTGVIHLGHKKTLFLVYEKSTLVDIRSISWGGDNIAKTLQDKYNISYSEGLKQLQSSAFILTSHDGASSDQIFYSNVISSCVNEMVRDLRLILMEIQSTNNLQINSISMTGNLSRLQNLAPFLTQGLELPVNKLSILSQYQNIQFEASPGIEATCGVALGLALEGLRKPRNPAISFLRGEFAIQSHALKNFVTTWGTTLKFAAIGIIALYVYSGFRSSMTTTMVEEADVVMKDQAQNLAKLKGSKASEAGIEKFISQKRKMIKELKDLEMYVAMNSGLEVLKKINDAAPGKSTLRMEVQKLTINDTKVHMEGFVATMRDTDLLQQSLKSLATETQIRSMPVQTVIPAGKIGFSYEFSVDRNVKISSAKSKTGSAKQ